MLPPDFPSANLGPSDEWIAAYKAEHTSPTGKMSIAPEPAFAWACEQILGSYSPAVVVLACWGGSSAWAQVRELHAEVVRAKERQEQY